MDQEKKQSIALMRYSAIAPIITGLGEEYPSRSAYFRAVSAKGILSPDGSLKHYSESTMERWYYDYVKGGFNALLPSGRSDCGEPRKLDEDVKEQIRFYKTHYPRMSVPAIHKTLMDNGIIAFNAVSESTILRYVNQIMQEEGMTNNQEMRRYERPHINEVWCGDSSVGPYLTTPDGRKHKVYIIALIDDASRFIVGADVFFNDNFINLMSVQKSAVSKYGCPRVWNFDNGSSYKNRQMELLSARIGSVIHYCHPYSPTEKSKIERWFRTCKDSWMASLDMRDFHSLDELRGSLWAYIQEYNNKPHSSLKGMTPFNRFFSEPEKIRRLTPEQISDSFLLEIERRVTADCVIMIDRIEYEVDYKYAKQKIRLRYSPDMGQIFVVEPDGTTLTPIRLLNKTDNASVKREKVQLCRKED